MTIDDFTRGTLLFRSQLSILMTINDSTRGTLLFRSLLSIYPKETWIPVEPAISRMFDMPTTFRAASEISISISIHFRSDQLLNEWPWTNSNSSSSTKANHHKNI